MLRTCATKIQNALILMGIAVPLANLVTAAAYAVINPQSAFAAGGTGTTTTGNPLDDIHCNSQGADALSPGLNRIAGFALGFRKLSIAVLVILVASLLFAVFNDKARAWVMDRIKWVLGITIGGPIAIGFLAVLIGSTGC